MKILIVKCSALGDVIHAFGVVSYLRRHYPDAQIDWVVEEGIASMVDAHPHVDHVHSIATKRWRQGKGLTSLGRFARSLRKKKYDYVFDLQGNIKSGFVTFFARAKCKVGFGKKSVPEWPNLLATRRRFNPPAGGNIRDDYLYLVASALGIEEGEAEGGVVLTSEADVASILEGSGAHVLVCPGSAWRNKQVDEKALARFLAKLQQQYDMRFIWLWGSAQEKEVANRLQEQFELSVVAPKLPLPALQNLMERVDLVISMDSLPLHLCATTSTPSFSCFGPSSGKKYCPTGERHVYFQGECPYGQQFAKRCDLLRTCKTGACLRDVCGERLFKTFEQSILPQILAPHRKTPQLALV